MKQHKRTPALFFFYDREKIEETLEKMSRKGWVLERINAYYCTYRAAEPKERRVSVVYVADGSEFNPHPTDGQMLLQELSAQSGWTLQYSWGQMQIYYSEDPDPVPLDTDPIPQVEAIHRAMRKQTLWASLLNLLFGGYIVALGLWNLHRDPVDFFTGMLWIWLLPDAVLLIARSLTNLIGWKIWYHRALLAAEAGEFPRMHSLRMVSWIFDLAMLPVTVLLVLSMQGQVRMFLLSLAGVAAVLFLCNQLRKGLRKRGVSRWVNLTVCIAACVLLTAAELSSLVYLSFHFHLYDTREPVGQYSIDGWEFDVYDDALPLTLEDLGTAGGFEYSRERQIPRSSPFVTEDTYRQWALSQAPEAADLEYTITDVRVSGLFSWIRDSILQRRTDEVRDGEVVLEDHFEPIDSQPWNADEAYQLHWSGYLMDSYLLCYGNRIVQIRLDSPPTPQQIRIISEKLGA